MTKVDYFNGTITHQVVNSKKLEFGKRIRTLTIADLHGYTNDPTRAARLAEAIKRQEPDIIFIAGDIYSGGKPWLGGDKLVQFRKFIEIISEVAPVCVTWGNHDLRGLNPKNKERRVGNLMGLETVRPGSVYPLYNDQVFINGMEVIGYVPRFELMEGPGLRTQVHGLAHDEFIHDHHEEGKKFTNRPGYLNVYAGHDPHLIAASENGVGLGDFSVCDYFVTGHLHDGYKKLIEIIDQFKKKITGKGFESIDPVKSLEFDKGWTDQPFSIVDNEGKTIPRDKFPLYLGPINLCRGIVYLDNDAQQKFLQLQDGTFYKNVATEPNVQSWQPVLENVARLEIEANDLHFMLISEGITPLFKPKEEDATFNVVDIESSKSL